MRDTNAPFREYLGEEYLDTSVTRTKGGWLCSLVDLRTKQRIGKSVLVKERTGIQPALKDLLRWHDKGGGTSPMASAARMRQKEARDAGLGQAVQPRLPPV